MNEFKSFFKTVSGNEGSRCHYNTRLDTYGCGCQHNCGYCYARSLLDFRKLWNAASPSVADIGKIRRVVKTKLKAGDIVRLGGMTDCFQPIEKQCRTTLQTIKALNEEGIGYLIVTKNDLVAADEYIDEMDKDLAHIQVSITCTDDVISRRIEPGAPTPPARIKAVEKLFDEGFDVSVRLSPYIPEIVDINVVNSIRCNKILVEFLRVNTWIQKWLTNMGIGIDLSPYCETHSGYRHMPLAGKRNLLSKITGFNEVSVCEDVEGHWGYWRDHINHNPDDCCNIRKPNKNELI